MTSLRRGVSLTHLKLTTQKLEMTLSIIVQTTRPHLPQLLTIRQSSFLLLLATVAFSDSARAVELCPVSCAPCAYGLWTDVPFEYCTSEWCGNDPVVTPPSGDGFVSVLSGFLVEYQNNINHPRTVWANSLVRDIEFRSIKFGLDVHDRLDAWHVGSTTQHTGNKPPGTWLGLTQSGYWTLQNYPANLRFVTDSVGTDIGFFLDQARVCCGSSPPQLGPSTIVTPTARNMGILLGQGDVVYFAVQDPPQGNLLNLTLWGMGGDIDLKIRCDAYPTENSYDGAATSSDSREFLQVSRRNCQSGLIYVAVYQYANSKAYFNLVASQMKDSMVITQRIGFRDNVSTQTMQQAATAVSAAAKRYFGITEGQHIIRNIAIHRNTGTGCTNCGGVPCDVCAFVGSVNRAAPPCFGESGPIKMETSALLEADGETLAHEWAHQFLCIRDEYGRVIDPPPPGLCKFCGHSAISISLLSASNLCVDSALHSNHRTDYAYSVSHCFVIAQVNQHNGSWQYVPPSGNVVSRPNFDPDPYTYRLHDFNNFIVTTIHP